MAGFLLRGNAENWLKEFFERKSFNYISLKRIRRLPINLTYVDWSIGVGAEVDYYFEVEYLDKKKERRTAYCLVTALWNFFVIKTRFFEKVDKKTVWVSFEKILSRSLGKSQI
jgi:hypothetical protein